MVLVPLTTWQVVHRCFFASSSLAWAGSTAQRTSPAAERISDFIGFPSGEKVGMLPQSVHQRAAAASVDGHHEAVQPQQILDFWFRQARKAWFSKDPAFDAEIRARFLALYERAAAGQLADWLQAPKSCLALVVLLDQFGRNMFRDSARAFAA